MARNGKLRSRIGRIGLLTTLLTGLAHFNFDRILSVLKCFQFQNELILMSVATFQDASGLGHVTRRRGRADT